MYISNFQPEKASVINVFPHNHPSLYAIGGHRSLRKTAEMSTFVKAVSPKSSLVFEVGESRDFGSPPCAACWWITAELITFGFCLGKNIHSRYSSYTCWYLQIWGVGVWQGWYSSITLSRDGFLRRVEDADHKGSGMLICYVSLCNMYISHQWNNGSDPQSWTCCFLKSYIETSTDQNFPTSEIDIADVVMVQNHRTSPKWLPCQ